MKENKKIKLGKEIIRLERLLFEARASYASTIGKAFDDITKASEKYSGSGVILEITSIGGTPVIPAVMIKDGLSKETVKQIQEDLKRSFELSTLVNPAMAR